MARKLKPLLHEHLDRLPAACSGCVFWESSETIERRCGSICDEQRLRDWYSSVTSEWGECGRVALDDDGEVLGFVKYAPVGYFPQATTFPARPDSPDAVLITCLHIRDDAREHGLGRLLVHAALRDLKGRQERSVLSFACASPSLDIGEMPMIGMKYLLGQGFTVIRPDPTFPLMQLDLRALASLAENLDAILQSLRIPLGAPARVPGPTIRAR
jgi:GNAT superfamily N-acetyltransferase